MAEIGRRLGRKLKRRTPMKTGAAGGGSTADGSSGALGGWGVSMTGSAAHNRAAAATMRRMTHTQRAAAAEAGCPASWHSALFRSPSRLRRPSRSVQSAAHGSGAGGSSAARWSAFTFPFSRQIAFLVFVLPWDLCCSAAFRLLKDALQCHKKTTELCLLF